MKDLGRVSAYTVTRVEGSVPRLSLRIETDTGHRGQAETTGQIASIDAMVTQVADAYLVGSELGSIEATRHAIVPYVGADGCGAELAATAVIEWALWDCFATAIGVTLGVALGGRVRDRIPIAVDRDVSTLRPLGETVARQVVGGAAVSGERPERHDPSILWVGHDPARAIPRAGAESSGQGAWHPTGLCVDGQSGQSLRRILLEDERSERHSFLLCRPDHSGAGRLRTLAVLAELSGCPLVLDGRGSTLIEYVATELACHLHPTAWAIVQPPAGSKDEGDIA